MGEKNVVLDFSLMIDICRDLKTEPMAAMDLVRKYEATADTIRRFVYMLKDAGFVHIADWKQPNQLWQPLFFFGKGSDAECPGKRRKVTMQIINEKNKMVHAQKFIWLLLAMKDEPRSARELVQESTINDQVMGQLLEYGHKKRFFRVGAWGREEGVRAGMMARRWCVGSFRDAPKPEKRTESERAKQYRAKKQAQRRMLKRGPMSIFNLAVL